jgi:glutathione S-transferase
VGLARRALPAFRWFYQKRHGIDAASRARAEGQVTAAFDRVEQERAGGPYLVGDGFSVADLTAAALLAPLVRPPESPHLVALELVPESVLRFREGLVGHPAFDWVLRIHRDHRGSSAEVR